MLRYALWGTLQFAAPYWAVLPYEHHFSAHLKYLLVQYCQLFHF